MPTRRNLFRTIFRQALPALVVIAMTILAFRSGVNVSDRGDIPDDSFLVQLYYALGLFALGGMDLGMPTGGPRFWQNVLIAAYFLAPALAAAAVIEGLWRAIWLRLVDHWPWRDHIVIAGGGRIARAMVDECRARFPGTRILVVEKNITDAQENHFGPIRRVHLLSGDMTEPRTTEMLRIGKARSLMLLTNDEFANVELAVQTRESLPERSAPPMLVRVADLDLLARANRMLGRDGWRPCVNIHKAVAKKICRESLEYMKGHDGRETLVFSGFGPFCQTYLREFIGLRGTDHIASIAIIDKDAELAWQRFFDGLPAAQQEQIASIRVFPASGIQEDPRVWSSIFHELAQDGGPPENFVVLLGTNGYHSNLKVAMRVRERSPAAYVMVRTFEATVFARQVSREMDLQIVDIAEELKEQLTGWVTELDHRRPG